jgi:hypothetical protein
LSRDGDTTCRFAFCPAPISPASHSSPLWALRPMSCPSTLPHACRPLFHRLHHLLESRQLDTQAHHLQLEIICEVTGSFEHLHSRLQPTKQTQAHQVSAFGFRAWGTSLGGNVRASESSTSRAQRKHTTEYKEQESTGKHNFGRPEGLKVQRRCRGSHQKS